MNLEMIKENEDGSADYSMSLSNEEKDQLIRFAFIELLKRGIEEGKKYDTGVCPYGPCIKTGHPDKPCICEDTSNIAY
jgi:hypothetical protein